MDTFLAHLRLARPANILTAIADILLGFAVSGSVVEFFTNGGTEVSILNLDKLPWLVAATIGLYGGGVAMNDVFDADLDRIERPERPIPSGLASVRSGTLLGCGLLLVGVVSAAQVSKLSALIAFIVAVLAIVYNSYGKHHSLLGPINMGVCRGGNLLLGMSVAPLDELSFMIALIPVVYINAITIISRGEVSGGGKRNLFLGLVSYSVVILGILTLAFFRKTGFAQLVPFLGLFAYLIFPPVIRALRNPLPRNVGMAVKMGVIALIVLDATVSVLFAGWAYGLLILLILPLSLQLSKSFAVT